MSLDTPLRRRPAAVLIVGAAWWLNDGGQVRRFLAPVLGTLASIGIALEGESNAAARPGGCADRGRRLRHLLVVAGDP